MGDGELAEGSVWEAAMSAAKYKLDNLTAIIDRNGLQISGSTEEIMKLEQLKAKWEAFAGMLMKRWHVYKTDRPAESDCAARRQTGMISQNHQGKGVSFMENVAKWHHGDHCRAA
jgi:transketolase